MNFKLFDDPRYWRKHFLTDAETGEKLTDLLELHFLELPKIKKIPAEQSEISPILFWLEFINDPESEKIKDMYALEEVYSEAKLVYEKAIADPYVQELIRVKEKADMDYKDAIATAHDKGEKIGIEKGEKKAKIETAINLIKIGLSVEQISSATGLSIEEIENI